MVKVVAVTGGEGFIGRRLVARLVLAGNQVRVLTRNSTTKNNSFAVNYFQGDLVTSSEAHLAAFLKGVDVLYHCAAEILDESKMASINIEGTKKLANAAKGHIKRWVQLSTAGVYGAYRVNTITEDSLPKPANRYESTKLNADIVIIDILDNLGIVWSILRPTTVYGVDMPNNSFRSLINMVLSKRFFYIGSKAAILPYIHVEDVANALILCGEHEKAGGEIFNLSEDVTVGNFVELIAIIKRKQFYFLRFPEFVVRMMVRVFAWYPNFPLTSSRIDALTRQVNYPANKIRDVLGYLPKKGHHNGLKEMLEMDGNVNIAISKTNAKN
jgi:nucleoside-diphosphate-sugar epimerase